MEHLQLDTKEAVAEAACQLIVEKANGAIASQGYFKFVLAGGTTPALVYAALASQASEWEKWHIYIGDERCLPPTHEDRNSYLPEVHWLSKVAIPPQNIHLIHGEMGPEKAAEDYAERIVDATPFDFVLLGLGEDGHTASLFPGIDYDESQTVHPVFGAPKPPPERVSLSAAVLNQSTDTMVLVTGDNKTEILEQWIAGEDLPVSKIKPLQTLYVATDAAARG